MEGKVKVVTKMDVAAAKAALLQRNQYPSTPKVRKELANTIEHSGNQNQVSKWLQELRDEEKAAASNDDAPSMPAEPLPQEIQEILDGGHAALNTTFTTLSSKLAATLTKVKTEIRKSADDYIFAAMAEAVKRAEDAETEAADSGTEIERLDREVERLQTLLEQEGAKVPPLRETLAGAGEKITLLEAELDTARKERLAAQLKAEEVAGELTTMREKAVIVASERDQATRQAAELQTQLEAATERNGTLAAELSDVKVVRAELAGENKQLMSERDHYREAAREERVRAERAIEEAHAAKAEVVKLTAKKVNEKKPISGGVPIA